MITEKLIAHRGWQSHYPENTLVGIEAALVAGAQHIEIDIQFSADLVPILCHDQLLQRICNQAVNINECDIEQLTQFSAYERDRFGDQFLGTPLSPLCDCLALLDRFPSATLYIEIKEQSLVTFGQEKIIGVLLALLANYPNPFFFISFNTEVLLQLKLRGHDNVVPVLASWQQLYDNNIQQLKPLLVFSDRKLLDEKNRLSDSPYPCAIYEVDRYQDAQALLEQGAILIETFAVGELIAEDKINNP
ncbi:MAG: glycerophosphoryl diester phosphodiesterase [Oceanicoccus sp.]|jgi:glycerophosphoryl diester phosphodiesterase